MLYVDFSIFSHPTVLTTSATLGCGNKPAEVIKVASVVL